MNIVKLTVENIMRVSAVEITPSGAVVVIGGANGAGKSSILSAIEMALGGKGVAVEQPVRAGQDVGRILLDLGEVLVERTFTAKGGTKLAVRAASGAVFPSPQAMLDHLVGKLAFDPLQFARADAKRQAETLRQVVGLDTTDLDAQRQAAYDARTEVNRKVEMAKAAVAMIPAAPAGVAVPEAEPDVALLLSELEAVNGRNRSREAAGHQAAAAKRESLQAASAAQRAASDVQELATRLERLRLEADRTAKAAQVAEAKAADAQRAAEKARASTEDPEPIRLQIKEAQTLGELVRRSREREAAAARHVALVGESEQLTAQIAEIDAERQQRVAAAAYPVPGLSLGASGVVFNEIPFSQASSAEQLRASVAIGLALNPKLKVMIVRDGSLLDDRGLALLQELAAAAGAQVWVERVSHGRECQFIIEDGQLAASTSDLPAESEACL